MKYVLTIAGSDSCGGAGIQADIKTITASGAHAMTAITAVTAQNSTGISSVHEIPLESICRQVEQVVKDIFPDAVKIGMLSSGPVIDTVAGLIRQFGLKNVVIDPVMRASTGRDLMDASSIRLLKDVLLPLADAITPNLHEAGILTGREIRDPAEMELAAKELKILGPHVIITGGHLEGDCIDILYDGQKIHHFQGERINTPNTHGTGCVFSSALATSLANGDDIIRATGLAHQFTRRAIKKGYPCGQGAGAVNPCS